MRAEHGSEICKPWFVITREFSFSCNWCEEIVVEWLRRVAELEGATLPRHWPGVQTDLPVIV